MFTSLDVQRYSTRNLFFWENNVRNGLQLTSDNSMVKNHQFYLFNRQLTVRVHAETIKTVKIPFTPDIHLRSICTSRTANPPVVPALLKKYSGATCTNSNEKMHVISNVFARECMH